jgi:hypothetical protein
MVGDVLQSVDTWHQANQQIRLTGLATPLHPFLKPDFAITLYQTFDFGVLDIESDDKLSKKFFADRPSEFKGADFAARFSDIGAASFGS